MENEEFNRERFRMFANFFSEMTEIKRELNEGVKTKVELNNALSQLQSLAEESRNARDSLEKQIADINAERELLTEELEREHQERQGIEEQFRATQTHLEEQLININQEMDILKKDLEREVQEKLRIEDEFCKVKTSLEAQIFNINAEKEKLINDLKNERSAFQQELANLKQSINQLFKI